MEKRKNPVYIITYQTKAIMYKTSEYYHSLILEGSRERYSINKPKQIIENSCVVYGATYKGRIGSVKHILNSSSKLPIPIAPAKGLYMIPTASIKNKDCVWVAYHHIKFYEQRDDKTYIEFIDGTGIYVNVSETVFDMQYNRMSRVMVHLNWSVIFGRSNPLWRWTFRDFL